MPTDIPRAVYDFVSGVDIPLTVSDPNLEDDPLILANAAFYRMTGFKPTEVIGRNCRFMQGADTRKSVGRHIRADFAAKRDSRILIRNYRKTGEPFDNFVYIFTVCDFAGNAYYRIGSQFPIPDANKAAAFNAHFDVLRAGLEKLNAQAVVGRHHVINMSDMVGISARDLLYARLQTLRSQM